MKSYSFKNFSKNYWLLYVGLIVILIVAVVLFCYIFRGELHDISAWASMISGIITYIGSSILGIFVFYHSWVQVVRQNESEDICVSFNVAGIPHGECYSTYCEDLICKNYPRTISKFRSKESKSSEEITHYIQVKIANLNHTLPMTAVFEDVFYLSDTNEIVPTNPVKIRSAVDPYKPIDYKDDSTFFVGVPIEVFEQRRFKKYGFISCFVLIKLENPKSHVKYAVIHYLSGKSWRVSSVLYTEAQYSAFKKNPEKTFGGLIIFINLQRIIL